MSDAFEIRPVCTADMNDPALAVYSEKSENRLYHWMEPEPGIFIAESPEVIARACTADYRPLSFLIDASRFEASRPFFASLAAVLSKKYKNIKIPVFTMDHEKIAKITGYPMTRGILAAMRRKSLPDPRDIIAGARRIAVLDNIENPTNVGAIFRSAAALFIDAVILTPGCADPLYRRAARVSMGNVFNISWTFTGKRKHKNSAPIWPGEMTDELKGAGFFTAALALTDDSLSIDDPMLHEQEKLALVIGNEKNGVSNEVLSCCDAAVKIPMAPGVDSLNAAAASAVAFWELRASSKNL